MTNSHTTIRSLKIMIWLKKSRNTTLIQIRKKASLWIKLTKRPNLKLCSNDSRRFYERAS